MWVDDVCGGKLQLQLPCIHIAEPESFSDDRVIEFVYQALWKMERHELDEHFFVDGIKTHVPHKNDNVPPTARHSWSLKTFSLTTSFSIAP